jgi:hypothetical protein
MDIKRVAFETRPVKSARPALATQASAEPARPASAPATPHTVGREEIAAIVDRFLAGRRQEQGQQEAAPLHASASPAKYQPVIDIEAGSMYDRSEAAPQAAAAPTAVEADGNNGSSSAAAAPPPQSASPPPPAPPSNGAQQAANGSSRKAVDFVSEDDVRRAIQKGEKIYVNARTIITPSARDMGEPAEVFAKA